MYATFSLPIEPTEPTTATDSSAETTQPVTGEYYFWYSTNDNIGQYSGNWKAVPMTKNGSSYYVSNLPVNFGSNFYFIVNKNADIPYRNTVWKTQNDVKVDCSTCAGNLVLMLHKNVMFLRNLILLRASRYIFIVFP